MITLSADGYVRLTLDTFLAIPLVQLVSGLDEDNPVSFQEGASFAPISGYTEWISTTTPTLTVGWDWQLGVSQGQPGYTQLDAPRSNVMLVDAQRRDLGSAKTTVLLQSVINSMAWQTELNKHIVTRYAGQPVNDDLSVLTVT
jgi:hypothetical protein